MRRRLGRPAMMLTFEPMPREYLAAAGPAGAAHLAAASAGASWRAAGSTTCACCASARLCVTCRARSSRSCWRSELQAARRGRGSRLPLRPQRRRRPPRCSREPGRRLGFEVDVRRAGAHRRGARQQQRRARRARGAATSRRAERCSAGRTRCAAAWCGASSSGATWGSRPRTCGSSAGARRCRASSRCACTAIGGGAACARRGEPRHAPDGGRQRAAARGARVRFRRRPVRPRDRGGVRGEAARRGALREPRRARRADARRCGARRAASSNA